MPQKLTDQVKKQICDFYDRDDISRQMPGMKDVKSIKSNTGTNLRIQKRTMIMSIREAFELFKTTYPETSVGKTLFYKERPAHVLPINDTPHNVGACKTHANYIIFFSLFRNMRQTFRKCTESCWARYRVVWIMKIACLTVVMYAKKQTFGILP